MKLLTLNTHSLIEENYQPKLKHFVEVIAREQPDIIALQEVNQTDLAQIIPIEQLKNFYVSEANTVIREDNHVYQIVKQLIEKNINYHWTWIAIKKGYEKYEEGIAILSRDKIVNTDVICVSSQDNYFNWKTRKIIGICTKNNTNTWFYSVHMGWWNDTEEPFYEQWEKLNQKIKKNNFVWLLGDFNNPAEIQNEGYDLIKNTGWYDTYTLAVYKDCGITVEKVIDGWKDKIKNTKGMRIDFIWCNKKIEIKTSKVMFNGKKEAVVSDHFGVLAEK